MEMHRIRRHQKLIITVLPQYFAHNIFLRISVAVGWEGGGGGGDHSEGGVGTECMGSLEVCDMIWQTLADEGM